MKARPGLYVLPLPTGSRPEPPEALDEAAALFDRGRAAYERREDAAAAALFDEAARVLEAIPAGPYAEGIATCRAIALENAAIARGAA
jgi:hypothetical protein